MVMGIETVVNPYNDPLSKGRKGLLVKSPWSLDYVEFIQKNDIKALYFNSAKGWRQSNFGFLSELNGIEEINILCPKLDNFKAIEYIRSLEDLSVTGVVADTVDFTLFPVLESCYLYWWRGAESILNAPGLKQAYLDKIKLKDYGQLCNLKSVHRLTIGNSPMSSLEWLKGFEQKLSELSLLNCKKIEDFSSVSTQTELRKLAISGSPKLYDLEFLASITKLDILDLSDSGSLKSLQPLKNIKSLKAFSFAGEKTTVEDKDLSVLTTLPKLAMLMFGQRRGYSHKLIKKWDWQNFDQPDKLLESV